MRHRDKVILFLALISALFPSADGALTVKEGEMAPVTRVRSLAAGMDDYVSKPIRINELVSALSRCCPIPPDEQATGQPIGEVLAMTQWDWRNADSS